MSVGILWGRRQVVLVGMCRESLPAIDGRAHIIPPTARTAAIVAVTVRPVVHDASLRIAERGQHRCMEGGGRGMESAGRRAAELAAIRKRHTEGPSAEARAPSRMAVAL